MVKDRVPSTRGVIAIKNAEICVRPHLFKYDKEDVTESAADSVGVTTHDIVKTLVMEDSDGKQFIVLMHGDMQVSTRDLARIRGVKKVSPTPVKIAERMTGYKVGGISPFGTRRRLPVYIEESILRLPKIFINGGRRGLLVELSPEEISRLLEPTVVNVGRY